MQGPSKHDLVDKLASADGHEGRVLLARAQLGEGRIVRFMGTTKGQAAYLTGLVITVAASENTQIRHRTNVSSSGRFYFKTCCASQNDCKVSPMVAPNGDWRI